MLMNWGDIVKAIEMGQYDRLLVIPEFRRLLGIRQLSPYHREDVWRHTCLTISGARHLSEDPIVWWAAACHDLGKGVGLLAPLGLHPWHGRRGARMIVEISRRLKLEHGVTMLAVLAARHHEQLRRGHKMPPLEQVDLLMRIGAVQHPGRLRDLMLVVEADVMGRDARSLRQPPDEAKESLSCVLKSLRPSSV